MKICNRKIDATIPRKPAKAPPYLTLSIRLAACRAGENDRSNQASEASFEGQSGRQSSIVYILKESVKVQQGVDE